MPHSFLLVRWLCAGVALPTERQGGLLDVGRDTRTYRERV